MFGEVFHELFVDEGVDQFGDDGQQGDWAVVCWIVSVFGFERKEKSNFTSEKYIGFRLQLS